ncbi:MAG: hypothetical protein V1775_08440 [Bacteroidota bacterium]
MKTVYRIILLLTIFSIAMGFLESAVVVYLRTLYYPGGFAFPLVPLENRILGTELLRELATLIMLLMAGIIAGKNSAQRFVFFLFCFAVWDIFYYVFLYFLIGWPSSLFDWDILFLLPVPWIGPVIAPCLLSFLMILLMIMVVTLQENRISVRFIWADLILMSTASLIILVSFTKDYFEIIAARDAQVSSPGTMETLRHFIPQSFNWFVFGAGVLILLGDFVFILIRSLKPGNRI